MDMKVEPVRGARPGEWFSACSGCCPRLRVKPQCRSLDSLRSLGMTASSGWQVRDLVSSSAISPR